MLDSKFLQNAMVVHSNFIRLTKPVQHNYITSMRHNLAIMFLILAVYMIDFRYIYAEGNIG